MSLKVSSQFFVSFTLIHHKFANHYLTRSHLNVKAHILPLIHVRNSIEVDESVAQKSMTGYGPQGWTISPLEPLVIDTQKFEKIEKKKKRHKAQRFQDKLHGSLAKLIVNWMPTVVLQK